MNKYKKVMWKAILDDTFKFLSYQQIMSGNVNRSSALFLKSTIKE